jgi:hypothetical protein
MMPDMSEACGIRGQSDYRMSWRRQEMTTGGQILSNRQPAKRLTSGVPFAPVVGDAEGVRLAAFPAVEARSSSAGFLICLTIQI